MLHVQDLNCRYGRIVAVHGAAVDVNEGEVVSLIGANGAGKTTLLRAISGLHPPQDGCIHFLGTDLAATEAEKRVSQGLVQVPEGRRVFGPLSVEENLMLGGMTRTRRQRAQGLSGVYAIFPVLQQRRGAAAGSLSGGEQQMLAIGRALMAAPTLLLLDEPSLGLAPKMVTAIFEQIRALHRNGTSVLLVEQNAVAALRIADRAYVMESGRIIKSGRASDLADDDEIRRAYLGE